MKIRTWARVLRGEFNSGTNKNTLSFPGMFVYLLCNSKCFCTFEFSSKFEVLNIIKMETKTFSVITSTSMILSLTIAALSIIGVAFTGFYPGIIVLLLVALIPVASKFYAKKIISKSNAFQRNYYTTLAIINLLSILVVLWMTFVIVHDRVLHDCC
ncbi:MAG: hypothetical protein JWP81_3403 [Ferruginibacter sp.]|nr:hypothetical protein [Ferruginibacter sp.]